MTQNCQRGRNYVEIKAYSLSTFTSRGEKFQFIDELKLIKFKNNRYMWKTVNTINSKLFLHKDDSIQIFLKEEELSRFGSFYYFKEYHLDKKEPFWKDLKWTHII